MIPSPRTVLTLAILASSSFAPATPADEGWVPLFDGKTLDGWKANGGTASSEVEGGAIVGTTVEGGPNTFLCKGDHKDFVLELEVKRKAGHPPSHRPAPPPERVDRTIEVPMPPDCPECHTPIGEAPVAIRDPHPIDLPEPKPVLTRFRVPVARCPACLRRAQGRHPEQTSNAPGSASVQYGPRLLGFAADPKHRLGASDRKCSSVLLTLTGVVVASAALVRSGHRLPRLAQPSSDRPVESAKASAVQHVDETGWKVGGRSAWLRVFAEEDIAL